VSLDLEQELAVAIEALSVRGVPYALCGGLALAVHGHPRATRDIDLLVPPASVAAALEALAGAGFPLRAGPIPLGAGGAYPQRLFRATKVSGTAHLTVDLLEVSESYASAWDGRQALVWKGRPLTVVSRAGLIEMKRLSSRLKDRGDLEALEGDDEQR
jgi:hypothetical protein